MTVTALVDSGSLMSVLPRPEAQELGLQTRGRREFEQVDKSIVTYDLGYAEVSVVGRAAAVTCVFGDNVAEPILGVTALELLGLAVDPVNDELVPARGRLGGFFLGL